MSKYQGRRMVKNDLIAQISEKQDKLTAGTGIDITEDTISVDSETVAMKSDLATVATSGDYDDLTNKPTIPAAQVQSDWNESDTTSKAYIQNKPTIPAAQVQSDWNQADNTQVDYIKNKPTIPAAVSGTNDGTNWTDLTIGSDTYAIPQGGGSSYTFTNGLTESSGTVSWDLNDNIKRATSGINKGCIYIGNDNLMNYESIDAQKGNLVVGNKVNTSTSSGSFSAGTGSGNILFGRVDSNTGISANGQGGIVGGLTYNQGQIQCGTGSIVVGFATGYSQYLGSLGDSIRYYQCFGTNNRSTSDNQMTIGKYNNYSNTSSKAFVIGNGSDNSNRSNAMTVDWDGTIISKNLPAVDTTTDGTYVLKATVSSGVVTYTWVLE